MGSTLTIADCLKSLRAGATTSQQLVEGALHAIEQSQPTLNAFRIVCAEQARAEAAKADERLAQGERLPLLGVPIAIKDDVDLEGHPTAFGCPGSFPPAHSDCEMVSRLRGAGAIIVGKTNTPELGLYPFTEGSAFGVVRSPWSLHHTPGGSSGGAAAAVAAGIVPAAIGSDGAGSIRIPAAWSNLVGLKPQRGRISTAPEVDAFNGLECLGPLTRTVQDAALLLDVLGGQQGSQRYAQAADAEPPALRIGLSLKAPLSGVRIPLDPQIAAATHRIASVLQGLGHTVDIWHPRYRLIGISLLARGEAGVHQWAARLPDRSLLDVRTRGAVRNGGIMQRSILPLAMRCEGRQRRRIGAAFDRFDVLIAPSTATQPLPIGAAEGLGTWPTQKLISSACPYAWPWNVLGWPALSVPAGITKQGLPVGVQLLGGPDSEATLISLAAQLQEQERWQHTPAPHSFAHPRLAGAPL